MNCHKAGEFMMKYMDNTLDTVDAEWLGRHISVCEKCAADFYLYDDILAGFSELELLSPPADFEERVMLKIIALPSLEGKLSSAADNMLCLVWGMFSVLFGIGALIALNRSSIMEYLYSTPGLESYAELITLVGEYAAALSSSLVFTLNRLLNLTSYYISSLRYILVAVLAVLAVVQYFMYRRGKLNAD